MVHEEFHPRFDATSRCYRYRLFCQPLRQPTRERFAWRVWPEFNPDLLVDAAKLFIGTHDFAAFGSPTTPKGTTVRTVMKAGWMQVERDEWQFEVQADAFLYRMVRRLVFVQVTIAQGKISAEASDPLFSGSGPGWEAKRGPSGPGSCARADARRSHVPIINGVNRSLRKETEN